LAPADAVDPRYGGPEYESLAAMCVNLGLDDIVAITKSTEMCNYRLAGLDAGVGDEVLREGHPHAGGHRRRAREFHDADGVIKLVEMITYRRGKIGDLLAEGSARAAKKLGRGSEQFLTTVRGMEMAMHDPRHMPVMYLMAPTGGDHMRQSGNRKGVRNQVGMCHFFAYEDQQTPETEQKIDQILTILNTAPAGTPRTTRWSDRAPRTHPRAAVQHARGLHPRRRSPALGCSGARPTPSRGRTIVGGDPGRRGQ
jgi:aldehyde:ferredoxin oxidoreductase